MNEILLENNINNKYNIGKMKNIEELFLVNDNPNLRKLINATKYLFYDIKFCNRNINNITFRKLSELFILLTIKLNSKLSIGFFEKYITYYDKYEHYKNRFHNKKHKYAISMYMQNKLSYNDTLIQLKTNKPYVIVIEDIELCKKYVNDIKQEVLNICSQLTNHINISVNDYNDNRRIFNDIINTYQSKVNNMYKFITKFNNPEMIIYNHIVNNFKDNTKISNVFTHFPLPVSRDYIKHPGSKSHEALALKRARYAPLFADILVVFDFLDFIHFLVIEYDGPTHSNIHDFRFSESIIHCDMTKNQFCINNNISLIRLNYTVNMNTHLTTINNIIEQILLHKKPIYHSIPTHDYYQTLLTDCHNIH